MSYLAIIVFIASIFVSGNTCRAEAYAINEQFESLEEWVPVTFPKIENHSEYGIIKTQEGSALETRSNGSASGIRCIQEFNVYEYPVVRWRWKVENVYANGNVEEKSGDDYPIRVYIMFKYDPEQASLGEKMQYGLARMLYGEYPPQSSLNYIWANKLHKNRIYPSKYTDRSKMVILRAGESETGRWVDEKVNIVEDYQQAFGRKPPEQASIAIMNDSDNTGEKAVSYLDYIQVMQSE